MNFKRLVLCVSYCVILSVAVFACDCNHLRCQDISLEAMRAGCIPRLVTLTQEKMTQSSACEINLYRTPNAEVTSERSA